MREKIAHIRRGLSYQATKLTLQQYFMEWLEIHKSIVKPRTAERYHQVARDYIFPQLGSYKLHDSRLVEIERLYQSLIVQGVSIRQVQIAHAVLHKSLKDAVRRGLVNQNAAHGARQPKMRYKEMQILDENQVMVMLISVRGDRNGALYHIAVKTGMRQGEILGLKWSDIDWNQGKIRVQRQAQRSPGNGRKFFAPKTKAAHRTISLGPEMLQTLREHLNKQHLEKAIAGERWQDFDLIFPSRVGTPQSGSNVLKVFKELLYKTGLPEIRFHDLRHTAASLMPNRGVPPFVVSRILGHSKPSTTMDIYGHLIPAASEGVGEMMDEMLTPVPVNMEEMIHDEQLGISSKV